MANKDDSKKDPSTVSMAYEAMRPKWSRIEALLGGTDAMRDSAQLYLPQHPEESYENYYNRLNSTVLYNMFELTLETLVGKPFSEPIVVNDDVPESISSMFFDIDMQGNNLTTFTRNWFRQGLAKAFAHVLIEMPVLKPEERIGRTRADDLADKRRPYWVLIKPENIIFASSTFVNGKEELDHLRLYEPVLVRDGFSESIQERIRILEPGHWEVWVYKEDKKKGEWVMVDQGTTDLDYIPLVTFYANRSGLMQGKPPLEDLAHLNIRHWQSSSDQINVLTVSRFPMLAVAGASDTTGQVMAIGPRQLLGTKDPQGRYYYVEHTGKAIAAGRQELLDLEFMMSSYGAEFLKRRPGNVTATARALDSAEATSPLQDSVTRFNDSINTALQITADWMGLPEGGSVSLTTDFNPTEVKPDVLETLLKSRENRDISRQQFLERLKELEVLSDEFDPIENLMNLKVEMATLGIDESLLDPNDIVGGPEKEGEEEDENENEDADE